MNTTENALTRFLIPLDMGDSHAQPVALMKCLSQTLGQRVEKITLLHVMAGRYLSQHMSNIDVRVDHIISSDMFQNLRNDYIEREIKPTLETAKHELESSGIRAPIEIVIEDGDPVEQIVQKMNRDHYSTLILQRSNMSRVEKITVGSVTAGIFHSTVKGAIYLTGSNITNADCSPKSCLIAIDESNGAQAALGKAAVLLAASGDNLDKVVLVHILDIAKCAEALAGGTMPKQMTNDVPDKAAVFLTDQGIASEKIIKTACCGDPAEVIFDEANKHDADMIFMGRRDRSALQEIFMGSVSRKVISRCKKQTVVLVSTDQS